MSHFYLTLPSNSSEKYYPDNTLTHFTTKLHNDMALIGDWEVGLTEIMYPRNWYNVNNQHMIISCVNCTKIVPEFTSDERIPPTYELFVVIPSGYYNSISELVDTMNTSIAKAYRRPVREWSINGVNRHIDESLWPKFHYNKQNRNVYLTLHPYMDVSFTEKLSKIIGIENARDDGISEVLITKSRQAADIEGGLHALYVYCDLLECVPVGDTMAPLLRIVQVSGSRGDMSHIQYDQPRYVPLQKKTFDSVEIDIRDDIGDPIPFDSGKLIVTLHFRRAKDSYFLG